MAAGFVGWGGGFLERFGLARCAGLLFFQGRICLGAEGACGSADRFVEFLAELLCTFKAHLGVVMEGFADDAVEGGVAFAELGGGDQWFGGHFASEELMEDDASGVDVGVFVDGVGVGGDFRGGVAGGAEDDALAAFFNATGETEVAYFGTGVLVEKDVGGLDVAVNDAGLVGVVKAVTDSFDDFSGLGLLDFFLVAGVVEGFAVDEFHADEEKVVDASEVIDGDEVGVVELGHGSGFGLELFFEAFALGDFTGEDFDGDFAVERGLKGAIDGTHAALGNEGKVFICGEVFGDFFGRGGGEAGRGMFFSAHEL